MSKFFLISKTILGGIIGMGPALLAAGGVSIPEFGEFGNALIGLLDSANEAVGLGLVVWGRATATKPITLLPKGS